MKAPTTSVSFRGLLDRLPKPIALLILGGFVDVAAAHAVLAPLPRAPRPTSLPTSTLPHRALDVVASWSWPIGALPPATSLPSPPPPRPPRPQITDPARLFAPVGQDLRRRADLADNTNTVCGYIGGDSSLAATCSAGSHCVLDTLHSVVGCCPNGQSTCTAGVFTGCVDRNSGAQTVVDPYVFTCAGSDVCYKNSFAGGFFQWGCGLSSELANTVPRTADGITSPLDLPSVAVTFSEGVSTIDGGSSSRNGVNAAGQTTSASGTATGADTTSSDDSKTTGASSGTGSSSGTGASSSGTGTSTSGSTGTSTSNRASDTGSSENASSRASNGSSNKGAIIGGAVGGAAGLIALIAIIAYCFRHRAKKADKRERVGSISPPLDGKHDDGMHEVDGVFDPFGNPRTVPEPPRARANEYAGSMYPDPYPPHTQLSAQREYAGMNHNIYPGYNPDKDVQIVQQLWNSQQAQHAQQELLLLQQQQQHQAQQRQPQQMDQTRGEAARPAARNFHLPNAYTESIGSSNRSREDSMAVGGIPGTGTGTGIGMADAASSYYGTRGAEDDTLPLTERGRPPRTSGDHSHKPYFHQQRTGTGDSATYPKGRGHGRDDQWV